MLVKKISVDGLYDFSRMEPLHLSKGNKLVIILRNRGFDRYTRDFLMRHPDAVVVHIGCGLNTRFERVDNSQVEWYDLDFQHVIELRRMYLGDEGSRYHLLGCSVLEEAWLEVVCVHGQRPFLFLAEGVFMYFEGAQVKPLVLKLRNRFPGAELVFDAYSPIHVWRHNFQTSASKINMRVSWGIWHGQDIEEWDAASPPGAGIHLLGEWGFFDDPTPRLARIRWARPIEALARTFRIYHFQLGKETGM
jgi:O-methyltransferase involved in polyketide biosynthesis